MLAFIFPGQGAQYPGMGRDVAEVHPEARQVYQEADEALGFALSELCFKGPAEELSLTEKTQPAILTTCMALFRLLKLAGKVPDFVAGHSLGEYSAIVAAGGLNFREAVGLVARRGRFMQEAVPVGEGAMAAVMGLSPEVLATLCREASQGEVVAPANLNAPDQIVIAGHRAAVRRAGELARRRGARRVVPLAVSAPFHCALMEPARDRLVEVIGDLPFQDLQIPLVNNVEARVVTRAEEVRWGLLDQVASAVLWTDCVRTLLEKGVSTFVEVGPGEVLSGLVRRIAPGVEIISIQNQEQLDAYV